MLEICCTRFFTDCNWARRATAVLTAVLTRKFALDWRYGLGLDRQIIRLTSPASPRSEAVVNMITPWSNVEQELSIFN